jgi:large subunit ribosomal protein L21
MLAVVKTGGKQYIVKEGETLDIEKIEGEEGGKVSFDQIFLVADDKENVKVGTPVVQGAKVDAEIVSQFKAKKIMIVKFKKKTGYRRRNGHRQQLTKIKVTKILS